MKRYFLHIAYNGAQFCGWQRQRNAVSVQQVLEEALSVLLRASVSVVGCGRTDAGVNAGKYFAHFDMDLGFADGVVMNGIGSNKLQGRNEVGNIADGTVAATNGGCANAAGSACGVADGTVAAVSSIASNQLQGRNEIGNIADGTVAATNGGCANAAGSACGVADGTVAAVNGGCANAAGSACGVADGTVAAVSGIGSNKLQGHNEVGNIADGTVAAVNGGCANAAGSACGVADGTVAAVSSIGSNKLQGHNEVDNITDAVNGICGKKFLYKLNAILPKEIVVYKIYEVPNDMHARFSAVSRTYKYYIHTAKNPFLNDFSCFIPFTPDIEAINKACEWLITQKDFTSFAKLHTDNKTNLCDLTRADIIACGDSLGGGGGVAVSDGRYIFTFTANRFLRNMVRAMVGTLLEVGSGRISFEQLQEIVAAKNRHAAAASVPANALFLTDVRYG
ncbi:MAG: tRNA pseudouridine(38-40) synthase TruA [Bacteroidales bacterium]|nr:tRNA pseudouridine(38-40) synthase TruA [Bacteroidales bacterium]